MLLAQAPIPDWGPYQMPAIVLTAAGLAVLAILRWRDKDVKTITEALEKKLTDEWKAKMDAMDSRVKELEGKLAHIENGSRTATMRAVEIKATSKEERTMVLAQEIIDALAAHPASHPL